MFDKMDRRVPLFTAEPAFKSTVRFLILQHLRASQYDASWTDSAVRRFAKEMGDAMDDVLNLSRADITPSAREEAQGSAPDQRARRPSPKVATETPSCRRSRAASATR